LRIVGRGPEEARLRRLAGPDVEFLGWRSDQDIRDLYAASTAALLPGVEDFGMVPVEAQACGTPVVALGRGGACETVQDGVTGILVHDNSSAAFADGLARAQSTAFDSVVIRQHAARFSRERFLADFQTEVNDAVTERSLTR
jgi:glycosyltransferase involved in cell wall biosynthesis